MPKTPSYRSRKGYSQALVTLTDSVTKQRRDYWLGEHVTAEYRVRTEARGRVVDEWKLRAGNPDNHWLDCLVGCAVAVSIQGAVLFGTEASPTPPRRRVKLSELQRSRR